MNDPKEPRGAVILPFRRRGADEPPKPVKAPIDPIERRYGRAIEEAKRERDAIRARMGDVGDVGQAIDKVEAEGSAEQIPLLAGLYIFRALLRDIDRDAEGALADAKRAVELLPDEVDLLRRAARIRTRHGDAGAIALLDHAAEIAPADADTYLLRGEVLAEAGDHERAMTNFNRVLTLDPRSKAAHVARMTSLRALGRLDEAIDACAAALRVDPNDADLRHTRAVCFEENGDYESAIREMSRALKLRPNEPYWHSERGAAYYNLGQFQNAIADYTRAAQIEPDEAHFPGSRAVMHWKLGEMDKALADLALAIRLDPEPARYHWRRGNMRLSCGDVDGAFSDIQTAVELDPEDVGFRADLARAHLLAARYPEAIIAVEAAISGAPTDADLLLLRAEIHKRSGDKDAALAALEAAVEAAPQSAAVHLAHARRLFESADYPKAAEAANAAVEISPDLVDALLIRGTSRCYVGEDMNPQTDLGGQADLDRAAALAPDNAMVFLHRGGVLFRRNRLPEALVELEKAVANGPDQPDMYYARGRVLMDLAEEDPTLVERVIADLTEAAKKPNTFPLTFIMRGMAESMRGDDAKAIPDFDRAIAMTPNDGEGWFRRARSLHKLGEMERSEADLAHAASLGHEEAVEEMELEAEDRFWF